MGNVPAAHHHPPHMLYGITGNTKKDTLWTPVADLVGWLLLKGLPFCLHSDVATGLVDRQLVDASVCTHRSETDLAAAVDMILSFGGDGTLLNTAHEIGARGVPVLGVNIGRLGFLADIEVAHVQETILRLESGDYRTESRMVLEAEIENDVALASRWALNEFVIERSGSAKLISIEVHVDGVLLNTYWADGLIVATPTGSTAYSLSTGGPIVVPGCGTMILTPIAPHTLTVRPIVIPDRMQVEAKVFTNNQSYIFAADGLTSPIRDDGLKITIRRAAHSVNLVKLPEQDYFETIRSKLMWGIRHPANPE
jgi:NAD+ kinase